MCIILPQSLWFFISWLSLVNAFELRFNVVNLSPFVFIAKMRSSHWHHLQTFFNGCNETIWPAKINVLTEEHEAGWEVAPGAWQTFDLPLGWFGRLCMPVLEIQTFTVSLIVLSGGRQECTANGQCTTGTCSEYFSPETRIIVAFNAPLRHFIKHRLGLYRSDDCASYSDRDFLQLHRSLLWHKYVRNQSPQELRDLHLTYTAGVRDIISP